MWTTLIRRCIQATLVGVPLVCVAGMASADEVLHWNNVLLEAVRTTSTPPPKASRAMAMVHTAIYDAVNCIDQDHQAYQYNVPAAGDTSREAAVAQAAHRVLSNLYPTQQSVFDAALAASLQAIPDGPGKLAGIGVGEAAANSILAARANDHSSDVVPYTPAGDPGRWEPTPTAFANPLLPNWPTVTPWTLNSGSQFRDPVGPPSLNSQEYTDAFNEVKEIGASDSAVRTAEQTEIAKFWADGSGTSTPPGHWNRIAQDVATAQGNTLSENARMFALLNMGLADAAIVCWDNKYYYDAWRPVTAIREADTDGNEATEPDATWTPLIATPPFPTYTSGHSTFSAAAATILAAYYGTDDIAFTTSGEGFVLPDRSFSSFSEAADEAALSRLYGGIHFRFDNEDGVSNGTQLGQWVVSRMLQPVPEPSTLVMTALVVGLGLPLARRRHA